jgi:hypothetical protein
MIESTYIRLSKAAEMLGADADTLLIAATESRIRLHWLLNQIVMAEYGFHDDINDPQADEPRSRWVTEDLSIKHFMYIPLGISEAAELLKGETTTARASNLSEQEGPSGSYWIPQSGWAIEGGGLSESDLHVTRDAVFVKRADIERILKRGETPAAGTVAELPSSPSREHVSDKLALMNQAAARFWTNVDRNDRGTHPNNAKVSAWLEKQGFSSTQANSASSIIRPEWVPTGRKPEE